MTNGLIQHITVEESTSIQQVNPTALRKAKIVYNFGLYECNRVKGLCELTELGLLDSKLSTVRMGTFKGLRELYLRFARK